jgi:ankyrin repeat protein
LPLEEPPAGPEEEEAPRAVEEIPPETAPAAEELDPAQVEEAFAAISSGDLDEARQRLEITPALIAATNEMGQMLIHQAVMDGHGEMVEMLTSLGCPVDSRDLDGWTPLHWAAFNGDSQMAALLLEKGADVLSADQAGQTPLHLACMEDKPETAAVLLANGAKTNLKNRKGETPLKLAGKKKVARVLSRIR